MQNNLFKNFKTLKEKESEIETNPNPIASDIPKITDNVSVKSDHSTKKASASKEKINKSAKLQRSGLEETIDDTVVKEQTEKELEAKPKTKISANASTETLSQNVAPTNPYAKRLDASLQKKSFTIFLKEPSLEFIKDFVFYKATKERLIFYNQSDTLIECLDLLKPNFPNLKERPDYIKEQEKVKKGGRKRYSDETYSATTSCYIPVDYWDFIKNVTYSKVISGDMYYKDWDLIEQGILELRKKYEGQIKPRPDYIREEEMMRGRRTKSE